LSRGGWIYKKTILYEDIVSECTCIGSGEFKRESCGGACFDSDGDKVIYRENDSIVGVGKRASEDDRAFGLISE